METVDVITKTTYIFFIYLLLAVFVERTVEIVVSIFNYGDFKLKRYKVWNLRAEKYQDKFDRLYNFDPSVKVNKMFNWILWHFVTEPAFTGGKLIISALSIRTRYVQIFSRLFANLVALGLITLLYFRFDVTFVDVALKVLPKSPTLDFFGNHIFLNIIISSVAVAAGVEPLHGLISKIENAGKKKSQS